MEAFIVKAECYSEDWGYNPNCYEEIHGIYTSREEAVKQFEKHHKTDQEWDHGYYRTHICTGIVDGEYIEKDITDKVLKELKKNNKSNKKLEK